MFFLRLLFIIFLSSGIYSLHAISQPHHAFADDGGGDDGGGDNGGGGDDGGGDDGGGDDGGAGDNSAGGGDDGGGSGATSGGQSGQTGSSGHAEKVPLRAIINKIRRNRNQRFLDVRIVYRGRKAYFEVVYIAAGGKVKKMLRRARARDRKGSSGSKRNFNNTPISGDKR